MFGRDMLAYIAVGVAMVPLAMGAAWALQTLWRPLTREQHAFALLCVITVPLLVIAVGSFTARYTPQGINSRYLFYICPLLFVGMVALVADRRPATWPLVLCGLGTAWVVYGAALLQAGPSLVSPDQTFHTVLIGRTAQLGKALGLPELSYPHLFAVGSAIVVALLVVARRGRWGRGVGVAVLAAVTLFCAAETVYSMRKIADTQAGVSQEFIDGRRWIDAVMPPGQTAKVIASTLGDPGAAYGVWWDVSFWNRSVAETMVLPTTPDLQQPFPQQFAIAPSGEFLSLPGSVPLGDGPYFVRAASDRSFGFRDAEVVAERFGIELIKTPSPPMADWLLALTFDDTGRIAQGGPPALLWVFPREPGLKEIPVRLTLGTWPTEGEGVQRYEIDGRRGALRLGQTEEVRAMARLDPNTGLTLNIKALGAVDATRGIQVLNVWIGEDA